MSSMNAECRFCRRVAGSHNIACPKDDKDAQSCFDSGWGDGRAGRKAVTENPAYVLGYLKGEAALEAAANVCRADYYG